MRSVGERRSTIVDSALPSSLILDVLNLSVRLSRGGVVGLEYKRGLDVK